MINIDTSKQAEMVIAHLAAIVTCSDDAIISKDMHSVITSWNKAAERLFGYSAEEAIGKSVTMLIPSNRVNEELEILERIRRGEPVEHYETVRQRKDGSLLDISLTVSPIRDSAGRIVGAAKIARDIGASKLVEQALRESEQRLRFVMDTAPQKLFTAKPDGEVDYFNPQWMEFTGLSFEQIKGGGWKVFIHPDDLEETVQSWQHAVDTGEPFHQEHRFRRADGQYHWHSSRAMPRRNGAGQIMMWVGSNSDIQDERQTAQQLMRYAAELSEASRQKDEFLAMLGHELRNPLAPISNAVHCMQLARDEQAARSALQMLDRQVSLMSRLVEDLLDAGRITRGKIELRRTRVELRSILTHAVEDFRAAHADLNRELAVTLPARPVYVDADADRLIQVVTNLLGNARKFTDTGGHIALSLEKSGKQAIILVRDDGIGLAADQLPRIFNLFVQIDTSMERSTGGLGIGLALAKNLVEMHGGKLEAQSAGLGQGCEFVVHLPTVAAAVESPSPQPATTTLAVTARRILIVDDNRDSAESMSMLLKVTGHQTRTAGDGLEAVTLTAAFRPDVVLMDIGLPKLNGYEAARQIRGEPWGKDILLVAVTGWGQAEDRRKSKDAGFDVHLVKPVDYAALMKLFESLAAS